VARAGFEVPDFLLVDEHHAEAFAGADRFDDGAEDLDAFAGGLGTRQDDVMDVVFGDAGLFVVRVKLQGVVAGEDRFRAGDADAGFIEAHGAVQLGLPVGHRRVAHALLGERIFEVRRTVMVLGAVHAGLVLLGRMNDEVLSLEGAAVGRTRDEEGTVGGGAFTHHDRGTGEGGGGKRGRDGERQGKLAKEHGWSPHVSRSPARVVKRDGRGCG